MRSFNMQCYVCSNELTRENETEEHIVLNAIGGKLKSKKLICISCNSKFGGRIDDKLAQQLQPIANLLNVKRDRGKPQNVKAKHGSKEVIIEPGGKMKLSRAYHEIDGEFIHIEAPSIADAKRVLLGIKRKYPHLDIDKALESAETKKDRSAKAIISMDFGGNDVARAFCKMAVNFFLHNGGDLNEVQHLLPFIEGKVDEAEVYYFYPRTEIFRKGKEEILHSLILEGDKERKQLYVIIELFNEFKMVVFLSKDYQGEDLYESYHYNLVTNEIVDYGIQFSVNTRDLRKFCSKVIDQPKFHERMQFLFQQIYNVTVSRKFEEIADSSMEDLIRKYPPEKYTHFTEKMINEYAHSVIEKVSQHFYFRGERP